jgi:periplasmic divalent cation tolerance protein
VTVEYWQVVTTTASADAAQALSHGAVSAHLAACGQVEGPLSSTYRWQGTVETSTEWRVVFKTAADRYPELERFIRGRHSYDVPEIVASPLVAGSTEYLDWLWQETRGADEAGDAGAV